MFTHAHFFDVWYLDSIKTSDFHKSFHKDFELIFNKARSFYIDLTVDGNTPATTFTDCFISGEVRFNGIGDLKGEDFILNLNPNLIDYSNNVHTEQTQYDWLVIATLITLHNTYGVYVDVESDASPAHWEAIAQTLADLFNKSISIPGVLSYKIFEPVPSNHLLRFLQTKAVNMQLNEIHCQVGLIL